MFSLVNRITSKCTFRRSITKYSATLFDKIGPATCKQQNKNDVIVNSSHITYTPKPGLVSFVKEHENEFMGYFQNILESLTEGEIFSEMEDVSKKFTRILEDTVLPGDKIGGITTVISYKMLEKPQNLTQENIELANILGWCVELFEGVAVIAEGFVNNLEASRNSNSCSKLSKIDSHVYLNLFILEHCIFYLLKKNFSNHPSYVAMVEFFHDRIYRTSIGHILHYQKYNIDQLTMDMFNGITQYKTGYYKFHFGGTLGMLLSGTDSGLQKQISSILLELGRYFQIRNDISEYFAGNVVGTSKHAKGRCTWLIVQALHKADVTQRKIIEDNYDKLEEEAICNIGNVYEELGIFAEFLAYETTSFKSLCASVNKIQNTSASNLLTMLIKQVYNHK